jgi:hypothetical protein
MRKTSVRNHCGNGRTRSEHHTLTLFQWLFRCRSCLDVNLISLFGKLFGFFIHRLFQRLFLGDALLRRVFPHVFRYLHAAKVWPAHHRSLRNFMRNGKRFASNGQRSGRFAPLRVGLRLGQVNAGQERGQLFGHNPQRDRFGRLGPGKTALAQQSLAYQDLGAAEIQ